MIMETKENMDPRQEEEMLVEMSLFRFILGYFKFLFKKCFP